MITLDPILQAAQDGDNHQPIISLVSESFVPSIPFEGSGFNSLTENETNPDIVEHTTGRLAAIVNRGDDLVLLVTDTDKTEWSEYTIYEGVGTNQACLCELSSGDIGIVIINSTYDIYSMIVDTAGTVQTAATLINNYSTWVSSVSVELLANGMFTLVYAYLNGSSEYSISKRTSFDFLTWSAVTTIAPSGLDNTLRIDNTHIRQLSSGEIFLLFDYVDDSQDGIELINCYLIRSSDNDTTWTVPESLTSYTTHGTSGKDPVIAERADGSVEIAFYEEKGVLTMNEDSTGWISPQDQTPTLHYDPASNKLYTKQIQSGAGTKTLDSCIVIDVATWTIEKIYTDATNPAYNSYFSSNHVNRVTDIDAGKYIVSTSGTAVMVINTEADTIVHYKFNTDDLAYGLMANVDADFLGTVPSIKGSQVDAATDRLYIWLIDGFLSHHSMFLGYIDLTEIPDPITGKYSWNEIIATRDLPYRFDFYSNNFHVDLDANIVVMSSSTDNYGGGYLLIYDLVYGGQLYNFHQTTHAGFPWLGLSWPFHYNGHVYGTMIYSDLYGNEDRYGLVDITLSTGAIQYYRPSWGTYDNYPFMHKISMGDGRLLMPVSGFGLATFDTTSGSWVLYDDDNVPGITGGGGGTSWAAVAYDPLENIIFGSNADGYNGSVVAFPENGQFEQLKYLTGVYDTDWAFGDSSVLVNGYESSQPAIVIASDDALWSLWSHKDITEQSLYWDQESASKSLLDYLTNDPVTASWEIDRPGTLSFSLSHGHLFDPSNSMSVLAPFLIKGRKIVFKLGETVDGTDYLQDQGMFVIKETKLSYKREQYPTITVSCEDLSMLWSEGRIIATEYFDNDAPGNILSNLLQDHAGLSVADIDIPTIENSHNLYHQFIDQDLKEMLDLILGHFGYFLFLNADRTVSARKIDLTKDPDHIYTSKIIDFTPDDSFSSFCNRVVVRGEGRYDIEVLYDMESVGTLAGTVLPFGSTETKRVWYSDDHVRTCRDPQLNINTSICEYELFSMSGGGNEYISAVDSEEHYVDISMEAPDLTGVFVTLAAAIIATGIAAIECTLVCGPFIFALSIETQLMGYALGSLAQYDYEIYAKPLGHENQTFQAEANDLVSQRELDGQVITEEIDDAFCYEIAHCQRVSTQELEIVKAQRNRSSFSKIAHLQDEVGDMLQINHPYTALALKIFLPKLTRVYQKGTGVTDRAEGWRV